MNNSFWYELSEKNKPIFIYGTGNGADKIMDILEHIGVSVTGVFASDGFVRDRSFRGFHVESYSNVRDKYGDEIIVIAAFGSTLSEVLDFLKTLDERHELYIPEVPLFCNDLFSELFDDKFFNLYKKDIEAAENLFADEESSQLYHDMIMHRLTGKLCYLNRTEEPRDSIKSIINCNDIKYAIDGGAFKGDTAMLFCDVFPNLCYLAAIEPDPRSYKKLETLAASIVDPTVIPINAMLDEMSGEHTFVSSGSRGSAPDAGIPGSPKRAKEIYTSALSVDDIVESKLNGQIDFLKLDTEGFELAALKGAKDTLQKRPALSISLYHRSSDIFMLPLYLREFYPDGNFYLRRPKCVPEWDLTLYVTN